MGNGIYYHLLLKLSKQEVIPPNKKRNMNKICILLDSVVSKVLCEVEVGGCREARKRPEHTSLYSQGDARYLSTNFKKIIIYVTQAEDDNVDVLLLVFLGCYQLL